MRENEIGIRCAASRDYLWFYPGVHLVKRMPIRFDEVITRANVRQIIADGVLTLPGEVMVAGMLDFNQVRDVTIRDLYFSLALEGKSLDKDQAMRRWQEILPEVVEIIRRATSRLTVQPIVEPAGHGVEDWHAGLLQELFG